MKAMCHPPSTRATCFHIGAGAGARQPGCRMQLSLLLSLLLSQHGCMVGSPYSGLGGTVECTRRSLNACSAGGTLLLASEHASFFMRMWVSAAVVHVGQGLRS